LTTIPFLDLQAQYKSLKSDVAEAIRGVLDTSAYILGPAVDRFETAFADYCGVKHAIGVNSGTSALALLLQAHGIGRGDEVITVTNTFFATVEAIAHAGAETVLVDCDPDTGLLMPDAVRKAVTPRTRAVVAVHLYGQPADIDALRALTGPGNLLLFEDAAQAHGARYKGRRAGSLADGAAFSFYPGKNLGAYGEAGAVTTDRADIATRIRQLRDHGSPSKYHHTEIGWNERMDGIQGAVLGVKLPHLDEWNARRRQLADRYRAGMPAGARPMAVVPDTESAMHLFVTRVPHRDRVRAALERAGIGTGVHYPIPIHLQPACAHRWSPGDFPNAERLADEILSLPMYAELTFDQVDAVLAALAAAH
jgi:dTDP-4-amino-4,6-dideoxygalactose transaminase